FVRYDAVARNCCAIEDANRGEPDTPEAQGDRLRLRRRATRVAHSGSEAIATHGTAQCWNHQTGTQGYRARAGHPRLSPAPRVATHHAVSTMAMTVVTLNTHSAMSCRVTWPPLAPSARRTRALCFSWHRPEIDERAGPHSRPA